MGGDPLDIHQRPAPVERVRPLTTGVTAPFFSLSKTDTGWQASVVPGGLPGPLTLPDLLESGPVIVSFYCPCWGSYARPFLTALTKLAASVQAAGGQFVVFCNEDPKYLNRELVGPAMKLVYDADYTVARRFGVYSEYDPIWDRVSGISEDVYVPALYVIDECGRIQYRFLDEDFAGFAEDKAVLNALHS